MCSDMFFELPWWAYVKAKFYVFCIYCVSRIKYFSGRDCKNKKSAPFDYAKTTLMGAPGIERSGGLMTDKAI